MLIASTNLLLQFNQGLEPSHYNAVKQVAWRDFFMENSTYQQKIQLINATFTPSSPVATRDLFCGRRQQLQRIINAIDEPGKHIVLYGERGVGKTSLANLVEGGSGKLASKITCESDELFRDLWDRVLHKIQIPLQKEDSFDESQNENLLWDSSFYDASGDIRPHTLVRGFSGIQVPVILIFDEFDRISDAQTRQDFSQILKVLSDNCQHITVMIVGIADNIHELIDAHPSVQRCTAQVPLPLMDRDELTEIVDKGFDSIGIDIDESLKHNMVFLSQGFPHYIHSLCKYSAITAVHIAQNRKESAENIKCDVQLLVIAVDDAISDTFQTVKDIYRAAVMSKKPNNRYESVLLAAALAPVDEQYSFRRVDLVKPLSKIEGKSIKPQSFSHHLKKLCDSERGFVLKKIGSDHNTRYSFRDPMVKAYILLKAYQNKHPELNSILLSYENR